MREVMLTTLDNPFDPFENFQEWYKIDMQFKYNTCALVARLCPQPSESLPESYVNAINENIIDRWVNMFPLTYKKVVRETNDEEFDETTSEEEEN